ncbi:hypothetical protein BDC45DRAFT_501155 [Circinella umbellata]|nr:hypothetical protein BDC45DRAFT_501155 [Circinella umbellata]
MENSNGRGWNNNDRARLSSSNERQQREQQNEQQRRMDIDRDDAEAGSILIPVASYSSHYRHTSTQETIRPSSARSMSIHNLLDTKPDLRISTSCQQKQNTSGRGYESPTMTEYRHSEMNTRASERSTPKATSAIGQEPVHAAFNSNDKTTYSQTAERFTKHSLVMGSYQNQPMPDLGNYNPKQLPRIKRNALHAYISYMIYTDLSHHQNSLQSKLATSRSTATGFKVVANNNNNNNNSSDRSTSAYRFPDTTFRKMGNMLSEGSDRSGYNNTSHRPHIVPNPTGSMPLLLDQQLKRDNYNNHLEDIANQVPQEHNNNNNNTILHKPLTAYLHPARTFTPSEQIRESEGFRPRSSASMPILPSMPPSPNPHHHHRRKF